MMDKRELIGLWIECSPLVQSMRDGAVVAGSELGSDLWDFTAATCESIGKRANTLSVPTDYFMHMSLLKCGFNGVAGGYGFVSCFYPSFTDEWMKSAPRPFDPLTCYRVNLTDCTYATVFRDSVKVVVDGCDVGDWPDHSLDAISGHVQSMADVF